MIIINKKLVSDVVQKAKNSDRLRKNYNFHETLDARLHRMLNAMEPGTYVQPHKHELPDKVEAFVVLTGKFLVVEFDDHGTVVEHSVISAGSDTFGVEIPPRVWHCILPLEPGSVVYEIKEGPYSPIDDKNFAPWAPREGDTGCAEYMEQLFKKCGL